MTQSLSARTSSLVAMGMISVLLAFSLIAAPQASPSSDEGWKSGSASLTDDVPLDKVEEQLVSRLGDRYTQITIDEERRKIQVGVIGLTASENESLLAEFTGPAEFEFIDSYVSRKEVDELDKEVAAWAMKNPGVLLSFGPNYSSGYVHMSVANEDSLSKSVQGISGQLGVSLSLGRSNDKRALLTAPGFTASIAVDIRDLSEQETASENPARAGKFLTVGSSSCTTGFLMSKGGLFYGVTAGHCGPNGTGVTFAGIQRGNIQNNVLYAANPAYTDAALYRLPTNGSASVFQTTTSYRWVRSIQSEGNLRGGVRTCTRGAFTGGERCGALNPDYINTRTWSGQAQRYVENGYCWNWESAGGTTSGDSGGPVYQFVSNGVRAVGVHRAGGGGISCFSAIGRVIAGTSSAVWFP